jgi:excisionase family DNA binding protein
MRSISKDSSFTLRFKIVDQYMVVIADDVNFTVAAGSMAERPRGGQPKLTTQTIGRAVLIALQHLTRGKGATTGQKRAGESIKTNRNDLLKIGDVAKKLGVSIGTVRNMTNSGALKSVQTPGGHRRYRVEDVQDYVSLSLR